jgi:hypothetical protein
VRELTSLLDYAQRDADGLRDIAGKLESERDEARAAAAAANAAAAAAGGRAAARLARRGSGAAAGGGGGSRGGGLQRAWSGGSSASGGPMSPAAPRGVGGPPLAAPSHAGAPPMSPGGASKWQVANTVGGGSLYGLDEDPTQGNIGAAPGDRLGGVDLGGAPGPRNGVGARSAWRAGALTCPRCLSLAARPGLTRPHSLPCPPRPPLPNPQCTSKTSS